MKKLKVSNYYFDFENAPYIGLENQDWIEYQEGESYKNALDLLEGKVDVALVPVTELANNSDYVALDYGFSLENSYPNLVCFSNTHISKLHTIYCSYSACSSAVLLKLLCYEFWNTRPKFVRFGESFDFESLGAHEGVLAIRASFPKSDFKNFKYKEDLVSAWHEWTKAPFSFMAWAYRKDRISKKQIAAFTDALAAEEKQFSDFQKSLIKDENNLTSLFFYNVKLNINEVQQNGLSLFFKKCADNKLLPQREIKSTFQTKKIIEKDLSLVANQVLDGDRISVSDAVRLVKGASFPDLALIADSIRSCLFSSYSFSFSGQLNQDDAREKEKLKKECLRIKRQKIRRVFLNIDLAKPLKLEEYEEILNSLRNNFNFIVEGFSVPEIIFLSKHYKISVSELIRRLATSGLTTAPGWGGEMLLVDEEKTTYQYSEWINTMRIVHSNGLKSWCSFRVNPFDTWEERLAHLHKIRRLQDLTSGFSRIVLVHSEESFNPELELKAASIARIFLDNIPTIQELSLEKRPVSVLTELNTGVNSVRVMYQPKKHGRILRISKMIQRLANGGLPIKREIDSSSDWSREVH